MFANVQNLNIVFVMSNKTVPVAAACLCHSGSRRCPGSSLLALLLLLLPVVGVAADCPMLVLLLPTLPVAACCPLLPVLLAD